MITQKKRVEGRRRNKVLFTYIYIFILKKKKLIKLSKHTDTLQLISQRTLFNVPARVILPDSRRVRIFCLIAKRYTAKSAYNRTISLGIYYESQIRAVYQARARRERTSVSVSRHLSLGTECVDAFRIGREFQSAYLE